MSLACTSYRFLRFLCRRISPQRAEGILRFISRIYHRFDSKNGQHVKDSLKVLRPQGHNIELEREIYYNFAALIYEFFAGLKGSYENEEELDAYIDREFGPPGEQSILALAPHCGNWELPLKKLLSRGYHVTCVALSHSHSDVDAFFTELRAHPHLELAELKQGMRTCMSALERQRVVALACERDYTGRGLPLEVLGHRIYFPKGPASMILRRRPKTFIVECQRLSLGYFKANIRPFELPPLPDDADEALRITSQALADELFGFIARHPEQWVTFDRTFHPLPQGQETSI